MWASLVRQLMLWMTSLGTTPLAQWHVDSFHDSFYDSLDCFGDLSGTCRLIPITQLLRARGKGWDGMFSQIIDNQI